MMEMRREVEVEEGGRMKRCGCGCGGVYVRRRAGVGERSFEELEEFLLLVSATSNAGTGPGQLCS